MQTFCIRYSGSLSIIAALEIAEAVEGTATLYKSRPTLVRVKSQKG